MATVTLESLAQDIAKLSGDVQSLLKMFRKMRNQQDDPDGEKAKKRSENNGFNRAMEITDELRKFVGIGEGETISRSMVTRKVNEYVKANNLKHPDNGRVICLDQKLRDLLKPPEDIQVTYLNIQRYLSPHYLKTADSPKPTAVMSEPGPSEPGPSEAPAEPEKTVTKKVVKRPVVKKAAA